MTGAEENGENHGAILGPNLGPSAVFSAPGLGYVFRNKAPISRRWLSRMSPTRKRSVKLEAVLKIPRAERLVRVQVPLPAPTIRSVARGELGDVLSIGRKLALKFHVARIFGDERLVDADGQAVHQS